MIRPFFEEMTIKHSSILSTIDKGARMFAENLMVQSFHWIDSQNSFYILENWSLLEHQISHSTVVQKDDLQKSYF